MKRVVPALKQNRSLVSFGFLVIGLILSTTAAVFAFRAFDADEAQRFTEAVDEIQGNLQARLDFFANSVRQLAAVYAIDPQLKSNEFINYTDSTDIRANDAGIYSYGVFRRQRAFSQERDRYFLDLREIGPHAPDALTPLGTEVTEEKNRIALFKAAIDSAHPVLVTRIPGLPPATDRTGQMMAAAAYENNVVPKTVEERRKKAIGIAYARFSEAGLFDQPLQNTGPYKAQLDVEIFDGPLSRIGDLQPLYAHTSSSRDQQFPRSALFEIKVGDRPFAVRVYSNHSPIWSTAAIIAVLILALGIAASLLAFRILRQRDRRSEDLMKSHADAAFLEEVSSILATSLDTAVVGQMLAQKLLALCDWCVIELLDDEGRVERHLWAASTPERYERLKKFYEAEPPGVTGHRLKATARQTKKTQTISRIDDTSLKPWVPDESRRRRILEIGVESVVTVPLVTQDHVLGTIALYSGNPARLYTRDDVHYFEEIALRSSLAFENARLYAESQKLNRAKDHFLAMLSHELRTPMNVILGWLEILTTEDVDDETYTQALETLNRNAKVQIQLINELLDVSRIINGKLSLHASKADLGSLLAGAIDSVQPATRAKNIEAVLKTEGDLSASVDSERIQQVLWNLLSNAVKFTPNGGHIDVRATGDAHDVRIVVSDTGQGIESQFLPYVFDRFRQEEGGFTRTQGGLGLGLSIVRYIVEGHGGTIDVASEGRGKGATFTVVLPKVARISNEIHFNESAP